MCGSVPDRSCVTAMWRLIYTSRLLAGNHGPSTGRSHIRESPTNRPSGCRATAHVDELPSAISHKRTSGPRGLFPGGPSSWRNPETLLHHWQLFGYPFVLGQWPPAHTRTRQDGTSCAIRSTRLSYWTKTSLSLPHADTARPAVRIQRWSTMITGAPN